MFRQHQDTWRFIRTIGICLVLLAPGSGAGVQAGEPVPDLEVFVRAGCPHCEAAKTFLDGLQRERPSVRIALHDVAEDSAARQRLAMLAAERGLASIGVPTFLLGTELIVGFRSADTTGAEIRARLDQNRQGAAPPLVVESIQTKWFGELRVKNLGLPLFTIVIGLLDGFNPCSMWVLIFMLSLLAGLANRPKMLLIAGTFVAVEGIAYFAFMAAWLNMFLLIGLSHITELILGSIAGLAGMINIKDFLAFQRGISLSIPDSAKPGLYARMRRILQAENILAALLGTVMLAVLVQAVELVCTAGLPALYTRILTMHQLDRWVYYGYLALYNVAYMLDDVLVLAIGVITMSHYRLQEREGRWLKLISGIVMVGLSVVMIVKPDWLM
ncbi:MAG: glutaredoxin family protein [Nitrospirota bacterium]|nr:glutaredoxin family protein [Nitrospirota bacterium]MDE3219046.1 glutaredoxin family protein [Nitrospirota bacterium]